MNTSMMIEMVGYLGSALVVVSMLMSSVVKLRIINTIGSVIFASYALIIHSYPTALMNACLVAINIYNLIKLTQKDQNFHLLDGKNQDVILNYMLHYYQQDIQRYFPNFSGDISSLDTVYIVCCNGNPVGVMLGNTQGAGTVNVEIEYSVPAYRDCSVGKYLYSKLPAKGIHTLVFSQRECENHVPYLLKMGFVLENDIYINTLAQNL